MFHKTTSAITFAILSATLIATACDPCEPTFTGDTLISIPETCLPDITGGDSSTGGDSTSTSTSTTADPVMPLDMGPAPLPVCIAIPGAGEEWGPCNGGKCAEGLSCKATPMGSVCLAACDVPGPCDADKCLGGTCDMDLGACVAQCKAVGDACPLPGMQCFIGAAPLCIHPD
jgi:hypothetical protein